MPSNPTAKYKVYYDGDLLPGYVQSEELPLLSRVGAHDILGRDGGPSYEHGVGNRELSLTFRVLTRLDMNNTGMQHLGDCIEQYREALRISSRVSSASTLFIGPMDHWLTARFFRASAPLAAPNSQAISYQMEFKTSPWFLGPEQTQTSAVSGPGTISLNMTDTRKTYPSFEIPSGITHITISHTASGKSFSISGSHAGLTVNCGNLTIKDSNGDQLGMLSSGPDFGIYHVGSGTFNADITNVVGSGNVRVFMNPRIER